MSNSTGQQFSDPAPSRGSMIADSTASLHPRTATPVGLERLLAVALDLGQHPVVAGDTGESAPGDAAGVEVTGITLDSRRVGPGDVYVALPGSRTHGMRFTPAAIEAGARLVLTDLGEGAGAEAGWGDGAPAVPVVRVADPRTVMAHWAAEIYGHPAERLQMFGITGTNGKTTTAVLLAAGLQAAGVVPGTIGTLGFRVGDRSLVTERSTVTTPESVDLHGLLAVMAAEGAQAVAMEVSSHAMVFQRAEAVPFAVTAFTNLGRDHLDFHPTMEDYYRAKAELFTPEHTRAAVVNIDDEWGARLAGEARARLDVVRTMSFRDEGADWYAHRVEVLPHGGSRVHARSPYGEHVFDVGLPGIFNAANGMTVAAMLSETDVDVERALAGLADATVPGRMQTIDLGPDAPLAVVDFAHTPQAVASALRTLGHRDDPQAAPDARRLVVVLGCGGDRDTEKREPMGAAAATWADVVVVTDDNPRSEEPAAIRGRVLEGARAAVAEGARAEVLDGGDRAAAIATALSMAGPEDVVAVLGKGHEQGQIIGDAVVPFDDAQELHRAWDARPGGPAS